MCRNLDRCRWHANGHIAINVRPRGSHYYSHHTVDRIDHDSSIGNDHGAIEWIGGFIEDITERKKGEEELQKTIREISDYKYALVAGESLKYLWILSREKTIPNDIKDNYLKIANEIGYNTSDLLWVEHSKN